MKAFNNTILIIYSIVIALAFSCGALSDENNDRTEDVTVINDLKDSSRIIASHMDSTNIRN